MSRLIHLLAQERWPETQHMCAHYRYCRHSCGASTQKYLWWTNQNPYITGKALRKGLLEVKQTSPSFNNFSKHQASRRGSQFIIGTYNRDRSQVSVFPKTSPRSVLKESILLYIQQLHLAQTPSFRKALPPTVETDFIFLEWNLKTLPTFPITTICSFEPSRASREQGHTILNSPPLRMKRTHSEFQEHTDLTFHSTHFAD